MVKIGTLILIHFFDKSEKQRKLVAQVRQRSGFKMKKEVKILRAKSVESLVLSIEHFNRPSDTGRVHAVLMLLDHAFEMLFKAIILHRGGRIREPRSEQTIGRNRQSDSSPASAEVFQMRRLNFSMRTKR